MGGRDVKRGCLSGAAGQRWRPRRAPLLGSSPGVSQRQLAGMSAPAGRDAVCSGYQGKAGRASRRAGRPERERIAAQSRVVQLRCLAPLKPLSLVACSLPLALPLPLTCPCPGPWPAPALPPAPDLPPGLPLPPAPAPLCPAGQACARQAAVPRRVHHRHLHRLQPGHVWGGRL